VPTMPVEIRAKGVHENPDEKVWAHDTTESIHRCNLPALPCSVEDSADPVQGANDVLDRGLLQGQVDHLGHSADFC
jgi:hypothetical protein